jgi:PucR family transcriptional regulator, purine catabolism regulatory protein
VHSAVALLTLTTERSRALQEAEQRLGAAVLRMLLSGEAGHARAVAGRLYGSLLDAPMRVIVAEPTAGPTTRRRTANARPDAQAITPSGAPVTGPEPRLPTPTSGGAPEGLLSGALSAPETGVLDDLADAIETAAARSGEAVLVVPDGERLVVLASDGGAAATACAHYAARATGDRAEHFGRADRDAERREEPPVIGVSAPAGLAGTALAFKQADQALSVARRRGSVLVEHEDVAAGSVLPLLADDAVRAFADGLLRKLYEHDAHGRGDLVASLRAWLSRHGQWDAAAADLGVHRHTLRYRMRRVEEILGRSLDDPDVRMELWLALKVTT